MIERRRDLISVTQKGARAKHVAFDLEQASSGVGELLATRELIRRAAQ
jgi:hypothetical protein